MCQPQPLTCATIKANARLRRSRQWKDQSEKNHHSETNNDSPSGDKKNISTKKKNSRRKRRPTKKEQRLRSDSCDVSTASTQPSSSDESFPNNSDSTPVKKSPKKSQTTRRKRSKKSSKSSRPNEVNVQPELSAEEKAKYVGLDCEMVGIGPGGFQSRLARVSLVDWDGEVIYDTCVKVVEKVTDYRTFVSGITEEDLISDDAVSFDEAQTRVQELLQDKILVGHGLKNDFKALGLSHPWYATRDTARYEPFMKTLDSPVYTECHPHGTTLVAKKLKVLAKDKLGMAIQEEGRPHSPVEDAVAALELYKKHRGKWERAVEWKVERTRAITQAQ